MEAPKDNDILARVGRRSGMTVPEGYFEAFAKDMEASLPRMPWEDEAERSTGRKAPRPGWWQRVRPYVYLAAMFAGVWCMMSIFDHVRPAPGADPFAIENNSALAEALSDDAFMEDYFYDDLDDSDLMWLDTESGQNQTSDKKS